MKTKQEIIKEIKRSGAEYVKSSVSPESCLTHIAIKDIENIDDCLFEEIGEDFWWIECYGY